MSNFFDPAGKVYEINDYCPLCYIGLGILVIVLFFLFFPPISILAVVIFPIMAGDIPRLVAGTTEVVSGNIAIFIKPFYTHEVGFVELVFWAVTLLGSYLIFHGIFNSRKNSKYIIDSKNNNFYIPLKNDPYCSLSDIDVANKRQESRRVRESYTQNGKTRYRTVTKHSYFIDIVGETFSKELSFTSKSKRDKTYSCLKIGMNSTKKYLADNQI